jgi:lysophospholipase L1-like esterase
MKPARFVVFAILSDILNFVYMISDTAKTIVCYGDSNTWGRIPRGARYPRSTRWVSIVQNLLGDNYEVISEGLGGRTFNAPDGDKPFRNGLSQLKSILKTHTPVDLVIIMLGTNDVKTTYNLQPDDIAKHLEQTIQLIRQEEPASKILVVCPTEIIIPDDKNLAEVFKRSPELSQKLPPLFKEVADRHDCHFINAQDYISSSKIDGFHLDPESHMKLAEILKAEVDSILRQN